MPFGDPPIRKGAAFEGRATIVPNELLKHLRAPIPVTITGSNDETFTVKGSTRSIPVWVGDDIAFLNVDVSYTWVSGTNSILDSDGAETTRTNSLTGVWYLYLGLNDAEDGWRLLPSQTAPDVSFPFDSGWLGHSGGSKTQFWQYVGFMECTSADLAFRSAVKSGFSYVIAHSVSAATAGTSFAELDFTASVPDIPGIMVSGSLETGGTAGDITHVAHDTDGLGEQRFETGAANASFAPFAMIPAKAGKVSAKHTANAGDVHITQIHDVV